MDHSINYFKIVGVSEKYDKKPACGSKTHDMSRLDLLTQAPVSRVWRRIITIRRRTLLELDRKQTLLLKKVFNILWNSIIMS